MRVLTSLAAVVFVAAAWHFLSAPLDWILQIVPDDAFYYLQIARNLAATGRATADGLSATNGFHPVWMAISTALAWTFRDRELLLRAALAASLILHAGVAVLLALMLRPLVGGAWAAAAIWWLLNPLSYLLALQGVEAMSYAGALLLLFGVHRRLAARIDAGERLSARRVAAYGACLGLVYLTRTEGAVVGTIAIAWLVVRTRDIRNGVIAGLASIAASVPWLLFSWFQVGTIVQDSGAMKLFWDVRHRGRVTALGRLYDGFWYFVMQPVELMTGASAAHVLVFAQVLAIGAGAAWVICRGWRRPAAQAARAVLIPCAAVTATYALVFSDRQLWWLVLPTLVLVILTFLALADLARSVRLSARAERGLQLVVTLAAFIAFGRWHVAAQPLYPWQPDVKTSQDAIDRLVPPGVRIGCFNAGIPMYFAPTGRIVALDGLVSHKARLAWTTGTFDDYVAATNVAYIADENGATQRALRMTKQPLVLEEVQRYPLRGWPGGDRYLWRVSRSGN